MSLGERIKEHHVPAGHLSLWWLGQAGYIFKSPAGRTLTIDPYLTNSCQEAGARAGFNMKRLVPPPLEPEDLVDLDLVALTHSHQDHLDPATIERYGRAGGQGPYLAPPHARAKLMTLGIQDAQIELTWPGKTSRLGDLEIRTVFAIPYGDEDLTHVGYMVGLEQGPRIYLTGDTAWGEILPISMVPLKPDVLLTVINPAFRNLGPAEAAHLARLLDVKIVIPCHYDLFPDNSLPPSIFLTNLKVEGIGERYRELKHGEAYTFPEEH